MGKQTDGAFDITCRPLLDLWGFVRRQYRLPSPAELKPLLPLVNYRAILLLSDNVTTHRMEVSAENQARFRVGLLRRGMKLDVGGIGKGFAVDKAVEAMKTAGARTGLVRAGGDLYGFGPRTWRVGVANPANPRQALKTFEIQNEAISTAGDYENYFEVGGRHYSHILNTQTGQPVERRHSVSVRAPTCALSDTWSTALFVNPKLRLPDSIRVVDMR